MRLEHNAQEEFARNPLAKVRAGTGAGNFQPFGHSEGLAIYSGNMEQMLDEVSHFRQSKCSINKYLLNKWLPH